MENMKIDIQNMNLNPIPNSTELNELEQPKGAEIQSNDQNKSDSVLKGLENPKEIKQNDGEETVKKHVLTYIAGGIWIDSNGQKWSRQPISGTDIVNVREYHDNDYQNRDDLQFMVNYGSMTITTITL